MEKGCPFWADNRQCSSKECGIGYCDDEVPSGLKELASIAVVRLSPNRTSIKLTPKQVEEKCEHTSNQFDPLDRTLSDGNRKQLLDMDWHDDNENKFCDIEGCFLFFFQYFIKYFSNLVDAFIYKSLFSLF